MKKSLIALILGTIMTISAAFAVSADVVSGGPTVTVTPVSVPTANAVGEPLTYEFSLTADQLVASLGIEFLAPAGTTVASVDKSVCNATQFGTIELTHGAEGGTFTLAPNPEVDSNLTTVPTIAAGSSVTLFRATFEIVTPADDKTYTVGLSSVSSSGDITAGINSYAFDAATQFVSTPAVIVEEEETPTDVVFTLKDVIVKPGEEVLMELWIDSSVEIDSIGGMDFVYDKDILTFKSFEVDEDNDYLISKSELSDFVNEDETFVIGSSKWTQYAGKICTLVFDVSQNATDANYEVNFTAIVKKGSQEFDWSVDSGTITVKSYKDGDINDDGEVTLADALALFKYSMMPERYPITYPGIVDFTNDGNLDINDALKLFKYSMMPERYPLF